MLPTGRFASPAKRAARLPPEPGREKKNAPQGFKLVYFRPVECTETAKPVLAMALVSVTLPRGNEDCWQVDG